MPALCATTIAGVSSDSAQSTYNQVANDQHTSYKEEQHGEKANSSAASRRRAIMEAVKEDEHLFCCPISHVSYSCVILVHSFVDTLHAFLVDWLHCA